MTNYHGTVYVLELQGHKYYVGHTKETDLKRILDHGNTRNSAQWTMLYKPLCIIKLIPGSTNIEDMVTLHAMEIYGWQNVRGGKWCKLEMKNPPKELNNSLLYNPTLCGRCFRLGHSEQICLWNTDAHGDAIIES